MLCSINCVLFFFFKQKTAYEMRISDWSSDVCSSDLHLLDLAYDQDIPIVATNPCCYAEPHFHSAHDTMLCIAQSSYVDSDDRVKSSPDAWMKPGDRKSTRLNSSH